MSLTRTALTLLAVSPILGLLVVAYLCIKTRHVWLALLCIAAFVAITLGGNTVLQAEVHFIHDQLHLAGTTS